VSNYRQYLEKRQFLQDAIKANEEHLRIASSPETHILEGKIKLLKSRLELLELGFKAGFEALSAHGDS
jgi:hypothetical protein